MRTELNNDRTPSNSANTTGPVKTVTGSLWLPAVLHYSRRNDLYQLFEALATTSGGDIDGSAVESADSEGIGLLLEGFRKLKTAGHHVRISSPSRCLLSALVALRLEQEIPCVDAEPLYLPTSANPGERIGELLVRLGWLEVNQLQAALETTRDKPDMFLGQALVNSDYISEEQLAIALAKQHAMPFVMPVQHHILDVTLEHSVPMAELRSHNALPLLVADGRLAVAVEDPSDVYAVDTIRRCCDFEVVPVVTTTQEIQRGLDLLQRTGGGNASQETDNANNVGERFDEVLLGALIEGASDIHIEPGEDDYLLRYRVDGKLHDVNRFKTVDGRELTARIKVLAGCDISEKRLPQDGRIHFTESGRDVDLRVNTMPTVYGEKTVMRILDRQAKSLSLEELGLANNSLDWMREAIGAPHGLVLVTGPTGSGKTTTLYSVLDEIVSSETNISTVENPVERAISGVNQTQINYKAGLTFGNCLHALLRQDPDVIMIGEIRDQETAEIAVEAALTGHLVLATLHTNDAPGAATRLIQMGVEPFLVATTLRAVMAQRLTRRLCDSCKRPVALPSAVRENLANFGLSEGPHYAASGCPACRKSGYDGRLGVFEVMRVDNELQAIIARAPSSAELRESALDRGMLSLFEHSIQRVNAGLTTLEEALRAGGNG